MIAKPHGRDTQFHLGTKPLTDIIGQPEVLGLFTRLTRRGGRVAEGGGLLNRYTVKSCIGGSNPPLSARSITYRLH